MGNSHSDQSHGGYKNMDDDETKKNIIERVRDSNKSVPISDEDLVKYTGKTRDELKAWAENRPGVGKNQLVGSVAFAGAPGVGGAGGGGGF